MNPRLDASAATPLRVAQLITHLARGGAQATVMGSLENPVPEIEMTLIAGLDEPGEGAFWEDERLQSTHVVRSNTLSRRLHPIKDAVFLVWLISWLRSEGPDVLHTHSSKPGVLGRLAGRLAGVPVVHTVHGWSFASLTGSTKGDRKPAITTSRCFFDGTRKAIRG